MVSNAGRPPGYPKTGGAKKGSVKTNTRAVKDAIREVFFDDLGGKAYLRKIAKSDPPLFMSLLAKLIPQEVRAEVDVSHKYQIDLGQAIRDAEANVKRYAELHRIPPAEPLTIDVTPTKEAVFDER